MINSLFRPCTINYTIIYYVQIKSVGMLSVPDIEVFSQPAVLYSMPQGKTASRENNLFPIPSFVFKIMSAPLFIFVQMLFQMTKTTAISLHQSDAWRKPL